jgi:hypothetical protein
LPLDNSHTANPKNAGSSRRHRRRETILGVKRESDYSSRRRKGCLHSFWGKGVTCYFARSCDGNSRAECREISKDYHGDTENTERKRGQRYLGQKIEAPFLPKLPYSSVFVLHITYERPSASEKGKEKDNRRRHEKDDWNEYKPKNHIKKEGENKFDHGSPSSYLLVTAQSVGMRSLS